MNDEWKLGMTFRLPARIDDPHDYKPLKRFFRKLMDEERVQVAYISLYCPSPNPHIHVAVSSVSHTGGALREGSFQHWEDCWNKIIRYQSGGLVIKKIFDAAGWQQYIFRHSQAHLDCITYYYNNKLLKVLRLGE